MAQDTAQATQQGERTLQRTGAKWPRTPYRQHTAPSEHTGEQQQSGPGQSTRNRTHRAGAAVNRSQVAQDTAQATQGTEQAHR